MPELSPEAPKREEQVLVLAAGGLTDKEIAMRLGISPDTVGTYWRRVLAKYNAASRTECVAKYMEARSKESLKNLEFVNECMRLVNEHMLQHGVERNQLEFADAILASIQQWIVVIDRSAKVVFSNRPAPQGTAFQEIVSAEDLPQSLELASRGPVEAVVKAVDGVAYDFIFSPGTGSIDGMIVGCGRPS